MERINSTRVLLGGLLAGLIINIAEAVLNAGLLAEDMAAAVRALGKSGEMSVRMIVAFNIWGFAIGISAVWLYAAIRPRFGPGPRTAVCAGAALWFLCYVLGSIGLLIMELFPARLMLISYVWGFAELIVATLAGAKIYQESAAPAGAAGAAAAAGR